MPDEAIAILLDYKVRTCAGDLIGKKSSVLVISSDYIFIEIKKNNFIVF